MTPQDALQAIKDCLGSGSEVARRLGIKPAAVNQWSRVPHERCLDLERLTEGKVTRYQMRPDIYGEPPAEAA